MRRWRKSRSAGCPVGRRTDFSPQRPPTARGSGWVCGLVKVGCCCGLKSALRTKSRSPALRMGVNLRIPAKTWLNSLQPEGLEDGSRWSRGKRGATTGIRHAGCLHPGRGARTVVPGLGQVRFWHPSGVHSAKRQFPVVVRGQRGNDHRKMSLCSPAPRRGARNEPGPARGQRFWHPCRGAADLRAVSRWSRPFSPATTGYYLSTLRVGDS